MSNNGDDEKVNKKVSDHDNSEGREEEKESGKQDSLARDDSDKFEI